MPADIDGIATLGDTPAAGGQRRTAHRRGGLRIRIRHRWPAEPGDVGVPRGRRASRPPCGGVPDDTNARRHGPGEAGRERARPAAGADVRDSRGRRRARRRRDGRCQRSGCGPGLFRRELAGAELPSAHGAVRNHQRTAGLDGPQRQAQRRVESPCGVPRTDDDGRLPGRAAGVDAVRAAGLRRADRRLDRGGGIATPSTPATARTERWRWRRSAGPTVPVAGFTATTTPRWRCRMRRRRCGRAPS